MKKKYRKCNKFIIAQNTKTHSHSYDSYINMYFCNLHSHEKD